MKFTLRKKINAAILSAFLIIALIFTWVQMDLQKKRSEAALNRAQTILKTLVERDREPLANEIFENRTRAIKIRINEMLKVKGIRNISVYSDSGKLLNSAGEHPATGDLPEDQANSLHELQTTKEQWHGESTISYLHEINVIGEKIGSIHIRYSLTQIEQERFLYLASVAGLLISILLVMVIIINAILAKTIIKPITALRDIMQETGRSGPGRQAVVTGNDEISDLTKTFNAMSADLENSYGKIEVQKEELRHTKNLLNNIIDSMPSALVGVDIEGHVTQWNKAVEEYTDISAENARGALLSDLIPWLKSEMEKIKDSIRSKQILQDSKRLRVQGDVTCYEDVTIYPLIANGVEGAVIRIDDVTEKVRLEEMMVQNEKMLSVGGLAAGMAHEINNPLAGMMQTAEVLANRLDSDIDIPANRRAAEEAGTTMATIKTFMEARSIPRMIGTMTASGRRVAAIVENMLSFARKTDSKGSSYALDDLLDKTLELAATDYNLKKQYDFKRIEVIKEYEDYLPAVPCERVKIQQVLLNILRNSAQAMQAAGVQAPCLTVRAGHNPERDMVSIEIADNGPGMDEKIRKRVFEPFFTTKPTGEGTGLGLSVSYFIITENHNGEMAVESRPGFGTTFIIRLPLSSEKTAS